MDDKLFEEMLQEIDAMTTEEYWSLYREAEQLINFPPEDPSFIQIQFASIPAIDFRYNFDNTFSAEAISIPHNYCQETLLDGDDVWLKVA